MYQSIDRLIHMTRVSRKPLRQEISNKILDNFHMMIVGLKSKKDTEDIFNDFLSKAEKIVFAKRLAIAIMLESGMDYRTISQEIKVSTGTVREVSNKLDKPRFRAFIRKLTRQSKTSNDMSWLKAALNAKTDMKARGRLYK